MYLFRRFGLPLAVLMMSASSDESGGGGGGGGGGEPPKPPTMDEINKAINAAVTSHTKRFESKVTEMFGNFGKSLDERFAALAPKPPEGEGDDKGKGGKVDPEVVKLKQAFEAQTKAFEAEKKARLDAEHRGRTEKAVGQLRAALGKHVRPEAVDVLLKAFKGDVQFDDQGEPVFPLPDGTGASTIDAAIDQWAKSDAAKVFLPAPSNGGAGTQQQRSGAPRLTRDPATVDPKTWTGEERAEMLRRNQEAMAKKAKENPFGFG